MTSLLLALADEKSVDVSGHADLVTNSLLVFVALVVAFFAIRPELYRRLFLDKVDPRPVALMRVFFAGVVLWTFVDLTVNAKFLFTDEGLWLTNMARKNYGGEIKVLWDQDHGFEHWWYFVYALWGKFTFLHMRSDPAFVYPMYALMLALLLCVVLGVKTRYTTVGAWIMVEAFYRYSPIFYTGGDTVVRVFFFLAIFSRWGEAYSFDRWSAVKRAIRGGASTIPPLRRIPSWPMRLMMVQLTCIYCATGLLKSGGTWGRSGTALYYALNLDHFYRLPMTRVTVWAQYLGVLPVMTWVTRWWEVLFPVALIGAAVLAFERDRLAGTWISASRWRRAAGWVIVAGAFGIAAYVSGVGAYYYLPPRRLAFPVTPEQLQIGFTVMVALVPVVGLGLYFWLRRMPRAWPVVQTWVFGKRLWLLLGVAVHLGIDMLMNVGTFANVMSATYFAWLSGSEVDGFWRFAFSRPCRPGEGGAPVRKGRWSRVFLAFFDGMRHRASGRRYLVHHHPGEASVRMVALLRPWDLGQRLGFVADDTVAERRIRLLVEGEGGPREGVAVGATLVRIFPGLWWLAPLSVIPGVRVIVGGLALRILSQSRD